MPTPLYFNDAPILTPEDDRFGIDPFARALAHSIREMISPIGAAIAINGKWGSGKSSVINLIRHHLKPAIDDGDLEIVDFKCWWFRGEEALTLAFLQDLNSALSRSLGKNARELIPELGKTLLRAGPVVGPAMNIATGGIWGAFTSGSVDVAKQFFPQEETVETVFQQLSEALSKQNKRFLVIVDDIDRLTPDEALIVFRLAKSVGRLPNVMYLLAFDRELAEKAVHHRYPSEGPHFLEKIIQASFEVPIPPRDDLNAAILAEIERQCGSLDDKDQLRRFLNVFHDAVAPYINSPRDVTRLSNAMTVSWPPVAQEVNLADFIALEVIRLNEGKLYNAIRTNKVVVCGTFAGHGTGEKRQEELQTFVDLVSESNREIARTALVRLFPCFENVIYSAESVRDWEARRLVCTDKHFDTYFRMAIGDETISMHEVSRFIDRCGDAEFVKEEFLRASGTIRRSGKSKVPLLLDEINAHAARIENRDFQGIISAVFAVADRIDLEQDRERGFYAIGDNYLRIHWLIRKLTFERCSLDERSKLFLAACRGAGVGWVVDFTSSAVDDHYPRRNREPESPEKCLVRKEDIPELKSIAIEAIHNTAAAGILITHPRLANILFRWRDYLNGDGVAVKSWTVEQLSDDVAVAHLAKAFTGESWSASMGIAGLGDRVSMRHTTAAIDGLDAILDVELFRRRLEELEGSGTLNSPHQENIKILLEAWRKKESGEDR